MKKAITILLMVALLVNLGLALIIESQKNVADDESAALGTCFIDGGCNKVQVSVYATAFGISNPLLGIVIFGLLIVLFPFIHHPRKNKHLAPFIGVTMILASIFSIWLLYIQFLVLYTVCIYCLWVDIIMIFATLVFLKVYWREVFARFI